MPMHLVVIRVVKVLSEERPKLWMRSLRERIWENRRKEGPRQKEA